ncbi:hypothetical protein GCM10025883_23420 [Mobilicoccus caccae]|uniref:HTH tetR-type domain-containing protein n=1 Tax=Mobilicoccus caccae TaxID=1859295 RepID=A0ABQ6IU90_9MICO|nr:hypothetical protein GCM10025883_23420 [Mobilicoccus caccae]
MSRVAGKSGPYHHGDLRAALVAEGLEIARREGPSALSLREVTRRAGVSPAAAYRHFRDRAALMSALGREIQELMATRMRARIDAQGDGAGASADIARPGPAEAEERAQVALWRLRGVGLGYIEFAVDEPGWFELAFFGEAARPDDASPSDGAVTGPGVRRDSRRSRRSRNSWRRSRTASRPALSPPSGEPVRSSPAGRPCTDARSSWCTVRCVGRSRRWCARSPSVSSTTSSWGFKADELGADPRGLRSRVTPIGRIVIR